MVKKAVFVLILLITPIFAWTGGFESFYAGERAIHHGSRMMRESWRNYEKATRIKDPLIRQYMMDNAMRSWEAGRSHREHGWRIRMEDCLDK